MYTNKCIALAERIVCVSIFLFTLPHGQPGAICRGFISISGRWILRCNELVMAKDSPDITVQCIEHFNVALVFLQVSLCCDTA